MISTGSAGIAYTAALHGAVLEIRASEDCVTGIRVMQEAEIPEKSCFGSTCETASELAQKAVRQLDRYFSGNLQTFDLPLAPARTPFLSAVRDALCSIPYGSTVSYSELACMAGYPKAVRAAALACRNNPLPFIVPCHRVVGKNGSLTGYSGGLPLKHALLELERQRGVRSRTRPPGEAHVHLL